MSNVASSSKSQLEQAGSYEPDPATHPLGGSVSGTASDPGTAGGVLDAPKSTPAPPTTHGFKVQVEGAPAPLSFHDTPHAALGAAEAYNLTLTNGAWTYAYAYALTANEWILL